MKLRLPTISAVILACLFVFSTGSNANATSVEDFYHGKTLTIYVGVSPGGGYSTFAQILANHLGKHIPGNPVVIVKHMPGSGGIKALNYVYNAAPKDGTAVITPNSGPTRKYVLGIGNARYDPLKYHWLGGWGDGTFVLSVFKSAGVNSLQDAMKKQVILGAIGKNDVSYQDPALINNTLGTKFKIIPGYRGGSRIRLAMEKGELQGWCGQMMGWKTFKRDWLREGKLVHLVQLTSTPSPDLPGVPQLTDFAKNDEQRQMFQFVQSGIEDRAFVAPPGVPADRLAALQKAYMDTLHDPAFLADATKQKYDVDPKTGKEIRALIEKMEHISPDLLARLKKAMGMD